MKLDLKTGLLDTAIWSPSPNFDARQQITEPEVIIVHCISLPPGDYGSGAIQAFFQNRLDASEHPYFTEIAHLKVSAHFLIDRQGTLTQFVATHHRAWHAGESSCLGRPKVNDFSLGVELEGLDTDSAGFTDAQYTTLKQLIAELRRNYPSIAAANVFAHSDIAPGRKTDPGPYFNWANVLTE